MIPMKQRAAVTTAMFKDMSDRRDVIEIIREFMRDFVSYQEAAAARKFLNNTDDTTDAEDLASNVQSVLTSISSYCLFATNKSEKLTALLNKKALFDSSVFRYICKSMHTASVQMDQPAAVLFRVKHLGVFVAYNGSMVRNEGPHIVIPATERGVEEIKIMSLEQFKANMKEGING
jgi:hypothetical protein